MANIDSKKNEMKWKKVYAKTNTSVLTNAKKNQRYCVSIKQTWNDNCVETKMSFHPNFFFLKNLFVL